MNQVGIEAQKILLPVDVSECTYINTIKKINADTSIHGILPLRPLKYINENKAIGQYLNPLKDVDACTPANMGKLIINDPTGLYPCTAEAIVKIIEYYRDSVDGLNICIINRSNVVGKPTAIMLTNKGATVSVLHSHTSENTKRNYLKQADIIVAAVPKKNFITLDMIKEDQMIVDAAVIREKMKSFGCCSDEIKNKTPVPGLGAITSAMLAKNVLKACALQTNNFQ